MLTHERLKELLSYDPESGIFRWQAINNQNIVRPHRDNKTGFLGVVPAPDGAFDSHICFQGKRKYLGRFNTPQQAHEAYLTAKRALHAGCTL